MSLFKEMDKLKKTLVEVAKKTTAGRHSEAPGQDASGMIPNSGKPKDIKHIRADTMTHMDLKLEKDEKEWKDQIPGGLSDNKTPKDFPKPALKQGKKIESEHTSDKKIATEIAMDHLTEDPKYYKKLETIEKADKPKRMWKIKVKGRPDWIWMVGMQDLGPNKGNNYLLEDGSAVHQNQVEDIDMTPDRADTLNKSDDPKETPRIKNNKSLIQDVAQGEYANARNSKIKNIGEDITNSARHKAMAWKGLKQAEVEGVADKLTNLKTMLKHEPAQLKIHDDNSNAMNVLAAHHALNKIPKAPEVPAAWTKGKKDDDVAMAEFTAPAFGQIPERKIIRDPQTSNYTYGDEKLSRHITVGELKSRSRELYVDFYNHMKAEAESLAHQGITHNQMITGMHKAAAEWLKNKSPQRSAGERTLEGQLLGQYHDYVKKAFHPRKSNSIQHHMHKFMDALNQHATKNGFITDPQKDPLSDKDDKYMEALRNGIHGLLKGKALTDVFNVDKKKSKIFDPTSFYGTELSRIGPDHGVNDDQDSHTRSLTDFSKMRGLQYGNSVTDDERKHHLGQAALAMRDLTHTLGLPSEMGSFNGRLGLAFGARGKGRAAAHYEPNLRAINLTRHNGSGSLAHEWGHAFDDILGEITKGKGMFATEWTRKGDVKHETPDHERIYKPLQNLMEKLSGPVRQRMTSDFYQKGRDAGVSPEKMSTYWLSGKEMFARAFEQYLQNKMRKNGHHNTYLAGGTDHWLWPSNQEVESLTPHFDELFENFRKGQFLKKSLDLLAKKDKLKKAFSYKGTVRPEASDKDGMPHPQKPQYVKGTSKDGPAWFYHPDVVRRHEQDFMSNYNKFAPKLSKLGQKHMHNLGRSVAADPDRHAIPTETAGGQHIRLRHLNAAMSGKPGYSIEEKDNGLHITIPRHSGRTDKAAETHSWRFDEKGLKFLGKTPINKSKGGTNDSRQKMGRSNRRTKEAGLGLSKPGSGREGSRGVGLKKTDNEKVYAEIASVAVINGNKLLMGKRNDNGKWTLPGGHLSSKEEPMEGAERELKEEANITPDDLFFMGSKNVVCPDGNNRMIHAFVCFGKYDTDTELDPDEEVQDWKWIDCADGLPDDVKKNLHSPKNVVLKYLGLQDD